MTRAPAFPMILASGTTVGVIGASARAAVQSLARAGLSAWGVDLFGDVDGRRWAPIEVCPYNEYPQGLLRKAQRFPPSLFLYTGGLENYPDLIATLMTFHQLWGNDPSVVRTVRDPWLLTQRFPEIMAPVLPRGQPCPDTGRWLRKPLRSGGGLGIRWAKVAELPDQRHYLQLYMEGQPASAVCFDERLLGITSQWIGQSWLHASGFVWCGNIGPWMPDDRLWSLCQQCCQNFQRAFGLRGVWGFDFVYHQGVIRVVEINPRYPASVEVLERASEQSLLAPYARPCMHSSWLVGKAIYYAPTDLIFPHTGPWLDTLAAPPCPWKWNSYADIPAAGTLIRRHQPVLTLLARGRTISHCLNQLFDLAGTLDQLLAAARSERLPSPVSHVYEPDENGNKSNSTP